MHHHPQILHSPQLIPLQIFLPLLGTSSMGSTIPFLFIMGTKVLFELFNKAKATNSFYRVKILPTCPPITHILFTDDLLFLLTQTFLKPTPFKPLSSATWSGQSINSSKSIAFIRKNIPPQIAISILNTLYLKKLAAKTKHLGLPLLLPKRTRMKHFEPSRKNLPKN